MNTEEIAFMRLGETATVEERLKRERELRELGAVMRDVVADSRRSAPNDRRGVLPSTPTASQPASGPAGSGWRDQAPLTLPPGQALIERMVNAALPHGPGHRRKPDGKAA